MRAPSAVSTDAQTSCCCRGQAQQARRHRVAPDQSPRGVDADQPRHGRIQQRRCHLQPQDQVLAGLRDQQAVFDRAGIQADHRGDVEAEGNRFAGDVEHTREAPLHIADGRGRAVHRPDTVEEVFSALHADRLTGARHDTRRRGADGLFGQVDPDARGHRHQLLVRAAGAAGADHHAGGVGQHRGARGRPQNGPQLRQFFQPGLVQGPVSLQGQMGATRRHRLEHHLGRRLGMQPLASRPRLEDGITDDA